MINSIFSVILGALIGAFLVDIISVMFTIGIVNYFKLYPILFSKNIVLLENNSRRFIYILTKKKIYRYFPSHLSFEEVKDDYCSVFPKEKAIRFESEEIILAIAFKRLRKRMDYRNEISVDNVETYFKGYFKQQQRISRLNEI